MSELEMGEHVDCDSGMMVRRESENEYYVRLGGEHRNSVVLTEQQIRAVAEISGLMGMPVDQEDWK